MNGRKGEEGKEWWIDGREKGGRQREREGENNNITCKGLRLVRRKRQVDRVGWEREGRREGGREGMGRKWQEKGERGREGGWKGVKECGSAPFLQLQVLVEVTECEVGDVEKEEEMEGVSMDTLHLFKSV